MNQVIKHTWLCALVIVALIFAVSGPARAQHGGHDGHDTPGMNKNKPKPKAQKKKQPKTKETAATPEKEGTHDMHKHASPAAVEPSPAQSPESQPSPEHRHANVQAPAQMASPTPSPDSSPVVTDTLPVSNSSQQHTHQHQGHTGNMSDMSNSGKTEQPTGGKDSMPGMKMDDAGGVSEVNAVGRNSLMMMSGEQMAIRVGSSASNFMPMGQMGSGTSWQPATTPMHMWHKNVGDWLLMFHGEMKLGVNAQGGPRGVTKLESQNWFMPMAFRRVGPGTLQLRGMFSLEPFTFPQGGSPQLFQTGETFRGRPIIDAQHPHDLFMELSGSYTMPVGEHATWFAYVGFPGEPALGPTAFMHRWSASENPSAPLSHHLQDSSHISFGVLTSGFTYRWFKLEGSVFNGREPGENRYNFEFNPWNSRSVRLSFAPNSNWSMQWSYGLLRNPEALEPGDVRRMTASIHYNKPFARGNWANSFIWGRNHENHDNEIFKLNGYTAESTLNFLDRNYLYTRLELVDKNNLLRHEDLDRLGFDHDFEHPQFRTGAYTFGAARDVWNTDKFSMAIGGDFTFYSQPRVLDPIYGSNPTSYRFFIRLRPSRMTMSGHGGGSHPTHSSH